MKDKIIEVCDDLTIIYMDILEQRYTSKHRIYTWYFQHVEPNTAADSVKKAFFFNIMRQIKTRKQEVPF